jgi:hypothetical protein
VAKKSVLKLADSKIGKTIRVEGKRRAKLVTDGKHKTVDIDQYALPQWPKNVKIVEQQNIFHKN